MPLERFGKKSLAHIGNIRYTVAMKLETVSQWGKRNRVPVRTVRYWCKRGQLPAKRIGSVWMIPAKARVQQ